MTSICALPQSCNPWIPCGPIQFSLHTLFQCCKTLLHGRIDFKSRTRAFPRLDIDSVFAISTRWTRPLLPRNMRQHPSDFHIPCPWFWLRFRAQFSPHTLLSRWSHSLQPVSSDLWSPAEYSRPFAIPISHPQKVCFSLSLLYLFPNFPSHLRTSPNLYCPSHNLPNSIARASPPISTKVRVRTSPDWVRVSNVALTAYHAHYFVEPGRSNQ